jgi:phosphatidylserine decarboxylase
MIHREGNKTLLISFLALAFLCMLTRIFLPIALPYISILALGLFLFLVSFFRNPSRPIPQVSADLLYAPADGKVVVIEETVETEFLSTKCKQVSIFMSPLNVHVNRNPIDGEVVQSIHHEGKFLPAWDPKSSTENERTTVVYKTTHGLILMRQVAGALAKRIVCYSKKGDQAKQGEEMGFIKFGSRVDLYLPLDADIKVKIGDVVSGNTTVIAQWK